MQQCGLGALECVEVPTTCRKYPFVRLKSDGCLYLLLQDLNASTRQRGDADLPKFWIGPHPGGAAGQIYFVRHYRQSICRQRLFPNQIESAVAIAVVAH